MTFPHGMHRLPMRRSVVRRYATRLAILWSGLAILVSAVSAQSLTPFQRGKAESMLRRQYGCLGCHRLGTEGGMLGPSLSDVQARRDARYIGLIITDPARAVPGAAMPKAAMPVRDRDLIIRYLGGTPTGALQGADPAQSTPAAIRATEPASPAQVYATWCAGCHGARGDADGPNARFLPVPPARHSDGRLTATRTDDYLYDIIAVGGAPMARSARMPAFGASLSPDAMRGLVRHIRTLCRCDGPAWSKDGSR